VRPAAATKKKISTQRSLRLDRGNREESPKEARCSWGLLRDLCESSANSVLELFSSLAAKNLNPYATEARRDKKRKRTNEGVPGFTPPPPFLCGSVPLR